MNLTMHKFYLYYVNKYSIGKKHNTNAFLDAMESKKPGFKKFFLDFTEDFYNKVNRFFKDLNYQQNIKEIWLPIRDDDDCELIFNMSKKVFLFQRFKGQEMNAMKKQYALSKEMILTFLSCPPSENLIGMIIKPVKSEKEEEKREKASGRHTYKLLQGSKTVFAKSVRFKDKDKKEKDEKQQDVIIDAQKIRHEPKRKKVKKGLEVQQIKKRERPKLEPQKAEETTSNIMITLDTAVKDTDVITQVADEIVIIREDNKGSDEVVEITINVASHTLIQAEVIPDENQIVDCKVFSEAYGEQQMTDDESLYMADYRIISEREVEDNKELVDTPAQLDDVEEMFFDDELEGSVSGFGAQLAVKSIYDL